MITRINRLYTKLIKSAAINTVDEILPDLPNTKQLSFENEYPAGDPQQDMDNESEQDFGHLRRIEGVSSNSAMLAIYPSEEAAGLIRSPFMTLDDMPIEDQDKLHVTVLYLGKELSPEDLEKVAEVARHVCDSHEPLQCKTQGLGAFNGDGESMPLYCSVDALGLAELHSDLIGGLEAEGIEIPRDYDFTPHMTISYMPVGTSFNVGVGAPAYEWESPSLFLVVGDEIREEFSLGGHDKEAAGFGLNLKELVVPSQGQGFTDNPADNHQTENLSEDPDLKLGLVEEPYSSSSGPLNFRFDDDKKYDIVKGADDEKEAVALPNPEPDEDKYGANHLREDQSIPRPPGSEGPLYGR